MFNQTKLSIVPSYWLAGVLLLPYLAANVLLVSHDIPLLVKSILVLFITSLGLHHIADNALLVLKSSVQSISITPKELYVHRKDYDKFDVEIIDKRIVFWAFCLIYIKPASSDVITSSLFSKLFYRRQQMLILSPWNVSCLKAYRRFRVLIKFGQHKADTTN